MARSGRHASASTRIGISLAAVARPVELALPQVIDDAVDAGRQVVAEGAEGEAEGLGGRLLGCSRDNVGPLDGAVESLTPRQGAETLHGVAHQFLKCRDRVVPAVL